MQVLFNTWLEPPLTVPQHAAASSRAGSGEAATPPLPAPCCRPRVEWSDAPPTRREGTGSLKAKIWLLGDTACSKRQHLAVAELGSCASGGFGRLGTPRGRARPTGCAATALVLELAASRVVDSSTTGYAGDERRRGQPERTRSVLAPAALEAALTEPLAATLFSADTREGS